MAITTSISSTPTCNDPLKRLPKYRQAEPRLLNAFIGPNVLCQELNPPAQIAGTMKNKVFISS